ncbi:hypothetical protein RJ640_015643 [Escallonia rubra]|uniref:Eukaryotic translation initiation factor 3 subunit J n=1 Tax=Escallonia rubra TaxID=112253 RepID=A0AA88U6L9_9ASTE|nr:hypothetical protein RJ640_015643 [Escallonia rubra]
MSVGVGLASDPRLPGDDEGGGAVESPAKFAKRERVGEEVKIAYNVLEDEPAPLDLKKEQPKSVWDDEDVDENDVRESWEDEDEPAPAPVVQPPAENVPKKSIPKSSDKKGKAVEVVKEAPLDPVAEKLRQQRELFIISEGFCFEGEALLSEKSSRWLEEEADYRHTAELFAKRPDEKSLDNFIPKSESDFSEYAELISHKLRPYEKSFHYIGLLKAVMRLSMVSLKVADAKEVASSVSAIANEKLKAEKEANAGKKKTGAKKKQLHVVREDDEVEAAAYSVPLDDEIDFM